MLTNQIIVSQRDNSIDLMKGFLTVLMILSHSMCFAGTKVITFTNYVNLTTFSSFMFCFGFVCNIAYLQKERIPWKRMISGALKTLGAYYLSAFMYSFIVLRTVSLTQIFNILTQRWVAGYSEFLLSWAYLYLFIIICAPMLKKSSQNRYICFVLITISLALTFIDYSNINIVWLGPLIGGKSFHYFPLLQYFSYFLIGSYFSQNKIVFKLSLLSLSFLLSALCFMYTVIFGFLPERWGPSLLWIFGSYFYTYLYYIGAKTTKTTAIWSKCLITIGRHSLIILLFNNFFCFMNSYLKIPSHHYVIRNISTAITFAGSILIPIAIFKITKKCSLSANI